MYITLEIMNSDYLELSEFIAINFHIVYLKQT